MEGSCWIKSHKAIFYVSGCNSLHLWHENAVYYPSLCVKFCNQCHGLLFVLPAQAQCASHSSWYQILLMLLLITEITTQLHVTWAFSPRIFNANAHYVLMAPADQNSRLKGKMLHGAVLYFKAFLCLHLNVILCTLSRTRFHFACKESIDTILF